MGLKPSISGNRVDFGRAVAREIRRLLLETNNLEHRKEYQIVRLQQGLTRKPMTKQEAAIVQEAVENVMRAGLLSKEGIAFDWSGFARLETYNRKPGVRRMPDGEIRPGRAKRAVRVKVLLHLKHDLNPEQQSH